MCKAGVVARMVGRVQDVIGKQDPLDCLHCGYRIHRDERLPRWLRGEDMGRRGWVRWKTFHEHGTLGKEQKGEDGLGR